MVPLRGSPRAPRRLRACCGVPLLPGKAACTTRNPIRQSAVTHGRPGIIYYCPRSRPFDFRNVGLHLLVCPRGAGLLLLLVCPAAPRGRRRRWFALPLMNAWHAGPTFKFLVSPGSASPPGKVVDTAVFFGPHSRRLAAPRSFGYTSLFFRSSRSYLLRHCKDGRSLIAAGHRMVRIRPGLDHLLARLGRSESLHLLRCPS